MLEESNLGGIFVTLNDGTLGEPYRILAVDCEGALRRRLLDMGLTPKTIISIRKVAPMGDPLELTAVSYTHLDVYKRQEQASGRRYVHGSPAL